MKKIEEPLAQVRKWKKEVSRITSKMNPREVIEYFDSIYKSITQRIKKA